MSYEVNGNTLETNPNGYLENIDEWSEDVANVIAEEEGVTMSDKHWDVVNFLRDEYVNNSSNQPNDRNIVKAMAKKCILKPLGWIIGLNQIQEFSFGRLLHFLLYLSS